MSEFITAAKAVKRLNAVNRFLAKLKKATAIPQIVVRVENGRGLSVLALAMQSDNVVVNTDSEVSADAFLNRFSREAPPEINNKSGKEIAGVRSICVHCDSLAEIERKPGTISVIAPLADYGVDVFRREIDDVVKFRLIDEDVDFVCQVLGLEASVIAQLAGDAPLNSDGEICLTVGASVSDLVLRVPPSRFIHDGKYGAERDGDFSWLWSGPDPHLRLFIGAVPFRPAEISVVIVSEGASGNLGRLRVLINGSRRDFRVETWDGGSGRISIDLDAEVSDPVVLSIAAPEMKSVANRHLGVCVGTLEIRGRK